jgi:hypothetical protein
MIVICLALVAILVSAFMWRRMKTWHAIRSHAIDCCREFSVQIMLEGVDKDIAEKAKDCVLASLHRDFSIVSHFPIQAADVMKEEMAKTMFYFSLPFDSRSEFTRLEKEIREEISKLGYTTKILQGRTQSP